MRIIDADALKRKAFGGRKGLVHTSDIDVAPTIDAIPVEWLRKYQSRMTNMSRAMGIDILLEMWQKEG